MVSGLKWGYKVVESRIKFQESSFKNQEPRAKNQDLQSVLTILTVL